MAFLLLLLSLSAFLQVVFWLIFALVLTKGEKSPSPLNLSVSVVVAARNEEANLEELIRLLMNQNQSAYEVIIVNDRSTDSSEEILSRLESNYKNHKLRVIHIEAKPNNWNGKKFALQKGIKAAKNDIILLTDADCLPKTANWIREMVQPFVNNRVNAVLGLSFYTKPGCTRPSNTLLDWLIENETLLTACQYLTWANVGWTYMGVGRNMAYRKKIFEQENGFSKISSQLGGDDDLWIGKSIFRKTTAICTSLDSQTFSTPPASFREWFGQKRRHLSIGVKYSIAQKIPAAWLPFSLTLWYLSVVCLVCYGLYEVLVLDLLRQLLIFSILRIFCNQAGRFYVKTNFFKSFLGFELVFVCYFCAMGFYATVFPPKKWN